MIVQEKINDKLIRSYSSSLLRIRKVGTDEVYDDAIDLIASANSYEETDVPVENRDEQFLEAGKILMGVTE